MRFRSIRPWGYQNHSTFNAGLDLAFQAEAPSCVPNLAQSNKQERRSKPAITFRGNTYESGSNISSELRNYSFAPAYRYDILHRDSGHLGILAQLNVLDIKQTIKGVAITPTGTATTTSSGSVVAPLPVFGPDASVYFAKNRLFVDANVKGMYFFGYGNYLSTAGLVGLRMGSHVDLAGDYQLGSRLVINAAAAA